MEKQKNAVGRRKEAVTRVFLSKGDGNITINGKDYKTYFPLVYLQNQVEMPLKTIESSDKFDVVVNAHGGGVKGQAEAVKLGIARALLLVNPEYRPVLKNAGLLTRDPRSVERKNQVKRKQEKASSLVKDNQPYDCVVGINSPISQLEIGKIGIWYWKLTNTLFKK